MEEIPSSRPTNPAKPKLIQKSSFNYTGNTITRVGGFDRVTPADGENNDLAGYERIIIEAN